MLRASRRLRVLGHPKRRRGNVWIRNSRDIIDYLLGGLPGQEGLRKDVFQNSNKKSSQCQDPRMLHKKGKKDPGNPTRASATKEMDQSRFAESARQEDASHHFTEHTTDHLRA
jgi:hypothetical protein